MNVEQFRVHGKGMVDYICDYMDTLDKRKVTPAVEPGYLRREIPLQAPYEPEPWQQIMSDVETKILPGVTHWQHRRFHAYFPSGNSFPSIMGDMLSSGLGGIGFSWAASPAMTELEVIVLDWMAKALGLPQEFLALTPGSKGGGVIQGSASECILVVMVAARAAAIKYLKNMYPSEDEGLLLSKLIAYCSKEAHSSVEKAAMISFVKLRILTPDENNSLRGETLLEAMKEDQEAGLLPFFVSTTLGTTGCCSFDCLPELGPVVRRFPSAWLHVDAAYAGSAFVCPEHRRHLAGIHYADSFNTNCNKWMLTNFDCSLLWVKDRFLLTSALVVDPLYLQHVHDHTAIDYRHWGIALSRRFRSLKLWFVMRTYGVSGLQKYIRRQCELAKYFESCVKKDDRFQICNEVTMGLVCFRLKGNPDDDAKYVDELNKKLLTNLNASRKIHMVPALVRDRFVIRFSVNTPNTFEDMETSWEIISEHATELLEGPDKEQALGEDIARRRKMTLAHKRSFFVRMVSDPKIYNPAINKSPPPIISPRTPDTPTSPEPPVIKKSWISWPLAFFFQSVDHDNSNDLSIRFRHLDTTVRLKSPNSAARQAASPDHSPERRYSSQ